MKPNKYSAYDNSRRFNKRLTILRPPGPDETDTAGQPLDDWPTVATVWGGIETLRGREFFSAQAVNAEVTTRIRIRHREGIDRTMRVTYRGEIYEVLYVIPVEYDRHELQLMCKARQ